MNNKIKLAVAGAVLSAASVANAGIIIPAGDWTLDVNGNVNAFYTTTKFDGDAAGGYGPLAGGAGANDSVNNITTGLLPNVLGFTGTTRQNDLDVSFTISIQPGSSTTGALDQTGSQENRQAFVTFGDKSWGTVKLGKDLGIFASDAILNDMTLLGVGAGAGHLAGNTTTLGGIGTGYVYADWKSQVAYTTPNMNGFQATIGLTQAFNASTGHLSDDALDYGGTTNFSSTTSGGRAGASPAIEAKASYSWSGDVAGKVWVSGINQKVSGITNEAAARFGSDDMTAFDIGATVSSGNATLTAYYYDGEGLGQTGQLRDGFDADGKARDSHGGYIQGTYVIPTGTKLGASYGMSTLETNSSSTLGATLDEVTDDRWTVGAYHPLTKHLNLVAEYSKVEREYDGKGGDADFEGDAESITLGAILFF